MSRLLPSIHEVAFDHPIEACVVIVSVMLAMGVPSLLGVVGLSLQSGLSQWLEQFQPVVYLEADQNTRQAEALQRELTGWESIERARLRSPSDGLEAVRRRLDETSTRSLDLAPSMFPHSLVLEPRPALSNRMTWMSRLEALETRSTIELVDLPDARVPAILALLPWGLVWVGLIGLVWIAIASLHLKSVLGRWSHDLDRTWQLLGWHGIGRARLQRRVIRWGLALGIGAGLLGGGFATAGRLAWAQVEWYGIGARSGTGMTWSRAILMLPVGLGPLVGYLVGWWHAHTSLSDYLDLPDVDDSSPANRPSSTGLES